MLKLIEAPNFNRFFKVERIFFATSSEKYFLFHFKLNHE